MALKDILVHVDNSKSRDARLQAVAALAAEHGAHLTGVYVCPEIVLPTAVEAQVGPQWVEAQQELIRQEAAEAEKAFRGSAEGAGLSAEWRQEEGETAGHLTLHARYADLLVLGQPQEDDPRSLLPGAVARVLLDAGRPVLVIPYVGTTAAIAGRVLVAWDGGRESARAVNDALPVLERARAVNVLAVNPPTGEMGHGDIPSADVCLHLARHGVKAEAQHVQARDAEVGDVILNRSFDLGADLIVMGAYGHSRMRELVLGGATRHLLQHMTAPVLMSH